MDLRQLEAFVNVVEQGSFSKAARALSLSQPGVSMQVKALEEELGETLIDRGRREVRLTPAGEAALEFARRALALHRELRTSIDMIRGGEAGSVSIGASTIPGAYLLPEMIQAFKSEHIAIDIKLTVADTARIIEGLLAGDCEVGFVGCRQANARLEFAAFHDDELVVIAGKDSQWRGRRKIGLAELFEAPFITREPGSGTRSVIESALREHGRQYSELQVSAQMSSTETVKAAVSAGLGVSLVSRLAVERELALGLLCVFGLKELTMRRELYRVTLKRAKPSRAVRAFIGSMTG